MVLYCYIGINYPTEQEKTDVYKAKYFMGVLSVSITKCEIQVCKVHLWELAIELNILNNKLVSLRK